MVAQTLAKPPNCTLGVLDPERDDLKELLAKLAERSTFCRHLVFNNPQSWYGAVDENDRVLAAYGLEEYRDGTISIPYAVCQPSKRGLLMLRFLAGAIAHALRRRRIVFYVAVENKRMLGIINNVRGIRPGIIEFERVAQDGEADRPGEPSS